jgi:hypothetical protein
MSLQQLLISQKIAGGGGGSTVTIDASNNGTGSFNSGGLTSVTVTLTVASNSNRVVYVYVCGGGTGGVEDVTGVSSNVDGALTDIGTATDSNFLYVSVWRLLNPTAGAHTFTASFGSFTTTDAVAFAISLYNVNQTTPNDTLVTASGSSTGPTASGSLVTGDMAVGALMSDDNAGIAVTTGTQQREVENIGGGNDTSGSLATNTGNGTIAITWSQDATGWAVAYVPVNQA